MGTKWSRQDEKVAGAVIHWSERENKTVPITYECCGEKRVRSVESAYRWRKNPRPACEQCKNRPEYRSGGRIIERGYVYLHKSLLAPWEHKLAKKMGFQFSGNYIAEHRLEAARKLGRALRKGEIVHHRDGKKDNNRHGNLLVYPQALHKKTHWQILRELAEHYEITK
jgi:hypothetical protein